MYRSILLIAVLLAGISSTVYAQGLTRIGGGVSGSSYRQVPEGFEVCDKCKGRKQIVCMACKGRNGGVGCMGCGGAGIVKCRKCGGTGVVPSKNQRSRSVNKPLTPKQMHQKELQMLRQQIDDEKEFVKAFMLRNGIACSNKTMLAELQSQLFLESQKEDKTLCALLGNLDLPFRLDKKHFVPLTKAETTERTIEDMVLLVPPANGIPGIKEAFEIEIGKKEFEARAKMSRHPYWKKLCEVHKWDDECCPKFGADYFTEDMKAKYFSNKVKAYELQSQGKLVCTCGQYEPVYKKAKKEYDETIKSLGYCKQKTLPAIISWGNRRDNDLRKLEVIEVIGKHFDRIQELVSKYQEMRLKKVR